MPNLNGVLETALYFEDLGRAQTFYEGVLGLSQIYADDRLIGYAIGKTVLLLFARGASKETMRLPSGTIPPTMERAPRMWRSRFPPTNCRVGKSASATAISRSRAAPTGRAAARASISAIPKVICWSSR